ncbi:response regulator [Rubrivirga sp. S365]|uniref:response regulator n=1 Tax=Rubrivirga sp. S365 TaxID=3076080 RepID=UPI0028C6B8FE|nr:response regulator [Rubrivirga sp. S365]MDT7856167.1 response regulator [Rubrivirga sp. S365]
MPRPRVLVADDVPENRTLFSIYLRKEYDVVAVATAEEALAEIEGGAVDAALLDLNYQGGMTGIELVARLRAGGATAAVPALALTAHASSADRERCLAAGFDAYLSKPVLRAPMLEAVRDLLGGAA